MIIFLFSVFKFTDVGKEKMDKFFSMFVTWLCTFYGYCTTWYVDLDCPNSDIPTC